MKLEFPKDELTKMSWSLHALGLVSVATAGLSIYFLMILPLRTQVAHFQQQTEHVAQFLQTSDAIQKENKRLTDQVAQQQIRWNNLLEKIPATAEESNFLAQITELSEHNDLKISSFSPGSSRENETCHQRDIQLTFTGTYLNLCHFLTGLKSISRLTNIEHLTIDAPNQNNPDGNYLVTIHFNLAYHFKKANLATKL